MKHHIGYLFLLISVFTYGCATKVNYSDKKPDSVAAAVEVDTPEYGNHMVIKGPPILKEDSLGRRITDQLRYRLNGWVERESGTLSTQLHISIMYESANWRGYSSAVFGKDQELVLDKLNTEVKCITHQSHEICARNEIMGISIPERDLEVNADKGFTVRVSSEKGFSHLINVPANYIQGYLMALNERGIAYSHPIEVEDAGKQKQEPKIEPSPTFEDGLAALQRGDHTGAYKIWLALAQKQDPRAQVHLSGLYAQGLGVERNDRLAQHWLAGAAFGGDASAQYLFGNAYRTGRFEPANPSQAVYWWQLAAQQGYADAQYRLGMAYLKGDGVERDPDEAKSWLEKAAAGGSKAAHKELDAMQAMQAETELPATKPAPKTGNNWIAEQPSTAYTIQLFATSTRPSAEQFIAQSKMQEELKIFSFERDRKTLYAVIKGSYSSIDAAREAVRGLPDNIQRSGIWIRNFASIQKVMLKDY